MVANFKFIQEDAKNMAVAEAVKQEFPEAEQEFAEAVDVTHEFPEAEAEAVKQEPTSIIFGDMAEARAEEEAKKKQERLQELAEKGFKLLQEDAKKKQERLQAAAWLKGTTDARLWTAEEKLLLARNLES